MKKLIFALICTIVAVGCTNYAFAAFIKLDAAGQPTTDDAACVMVKDDVTNLIWERKNTSNKDQKYYALPPELWTDPKSADDPEYVGNYIKSLNELNSSGLGGYTDWRVPSIRELATIIDLEKASAPAINADYFPNINSGHYWTSSSYELGGVQYDDEGNPFYTKAWTINFLNGANNSSLDKTGTNYVIAVRGNALETPTFTADSTKNIVKNNNTGLVWQKTPGSATKAWASISEYLSTLSAVQIDNACYAWKLPTAQELMSIINYEKSSSPVAYNDFSAVSARYWTSTPDAQNTARAWYADFTNGTVGTIGKTTAYRVWAIADMSNPVICPDPPAYPKGDITHDTHVDLSDAIAGLKVLDGITVTVYTDTDVNGDGKIGQEEVIYALQVTATLRPQQ